MDVLNNALTFIQAHRGFFHGLAAGPTLLLGLVFTLDSSFIVGIMLLIFSGFMCYNGLNKSR